MRIAEALRLTEALQTDLYHALLRQLIYGLG